MEFSLLNARAMTKPRFTVWHELRRDQDLLLTGTSQIACLSATRFKPRPIPEPLLSLIQAGVPA